MTTRDDINAGTPRTPEEIQAEIERSRAVVHQDMKAIGEKFTPDQVKENAKGVVSDAKQEGATMVREAKDAAVGSVRSARDNAIETVSETLHDLGDRARHAGQVTADYAHQAGDYMRQAGSSTGSFVAANALPLSLIGIGVGLLALGMRRQNTQTRYMDDYDYGYEDDYLGLEGETGYEYESGASRTGRTGGRPGRVNQLASNVRSRAEGVAHSARDRAQGIADTTRERAHDIAETARERAESLANSARERATSVADSARGLAEGARERASALAERASSGVQTARTRVSETASHLGTQASELSREAKVRLERAQIRTRDYADENPLAVGAIAIAAGVGVGLLLPTTQPENRLMGSARDRLLGDARGLIDEARHAGEIVTQKARETAQELRNTASDARLSH